MWEMDEHQKITSTNGFLVYIYCCVLSYSIIRTIDKHYKGRLDSSAFLILGVILLILAAGLAGTLALTNLLGPKVGAHLIGCQCWFLHAWFRGHNWYPMFTHYIWNRWHSLVTLDQKFVVFVSLSSRLY